MKDCDKTALRQRFRWSAAGQLHVRNGKCIAGPIKNEADIATIELFFRRYQPFDPNPDFTQSQQ